MKKQFRLRRTEDFVRVRQEGRSYRHPFFIINLAPNGLPHNRYGFITAKRLGKAVVRNRVRRRLRESVRHLHPSLPPGHDIVIIARLSVVGQPWETLHQTLAATFSRAGLKIDYQNRDKRK